MFGVKWSSLLDNQHRSKLVKDFISIEESKLLAIMVNAIRMANCRMEKNNK